MRSPGRVAAYLGQAAEHLGVPFEFHRIDLSDHNLQLLDSIKRRPGETLVVCSGFDIKFLNDGPKGVGVFKLMQVTGGACTGQYSSVLTTIGCSAPLWSAW